MDMSHSIRLNVMNLRLKKGWSQDELAVQVNKTRTWVSHLETGRTKVIKPEHVETLAKVFGVSPSSLISNENVQKDTETEVLEVVIEEDCDDTYWIIVVDQADEKKGYYIGDDITLIMKNKKKTFRELALKNGAEMEWNDQIAQYEFVFTNEDAAIKTKKELEKLI